MPLPPTTPPEPGEASGRLPHLPRLPVLWQDEHLVAIHKPAGWLVHRTGLDAGETRIVVQALRDQLGGRHVWPVHRLDKGTCGVLLLALDADVARAMGELWRGQQVRKHYLALVRGWLPGELTVDHALRPDDAPPDAPPQPALTELRCLARLERDEASQPPHPTTRASLVLARPLTGRRHQIRRHAKHVAHPLIGDATHGKGPLNRWWAQRLGLQRLWLHAWSLAFTHPVTLRPVAIESGLRLQAPPAPFALDASSPGAQAAQEWLHLNAAGRWLAPGP